MTQETIVRIQGDEPGTECGADDCNAKATHFPVLLLRPKGFKGPPFRAVLKVPLCEDHKKVADVSHFISGPDDPMWVQMSTLLRAQNRQPPKYSRTTIEFCEIDSEEARK